MADHTPGPWSEDTSHPEFEGITIWATDVIIANTIPDQHDQHKANARLITAAPTMLNTLQYIAWCFDGFPLGYEGECEGFMTAKGLADIRAAIAQATGEPCDCAGCNTCGSHCIGGCASGHGEPCLATAQPVTP